MIERTEEQQAWMDAHIPERPPAFDFVNFMKDLKYLSLPVLLKDLMAVFQEEFPEEAIRIQDTQSKDGELVAPWEDVTANTFDSLPPSRQLWAATVLDYMFEHLTHRGYRLMLVKIVERS